MNSGVRPQGREQVTRAVIDACERLAERTVPSRFTIKQLSAEAGVTTSLLYFYFESKDDIVAATLRSIATEIDEAASAVAEPAEMIRAAVTFVWERPAFPRMLAALILEGHNVTELMGDHPFLRRLGAAAASTTLDTDPQTAAGLAVTIILGAGSYGRAVNVAIGRDPSDQRLPEAIRRVAASRA